MRPEVPSEHQATLPLPLDSQQLPRVLLAHLLRLQRRALLVNQLLPALLASLRPRHPPARSEPQQQLHRALSEPPRRQHQSLDSPPNLRVLLDNPLNPHPPSVRLPGQPIPSVPRLLNLQAHSDNHHNPLPPLASPLNPQIPSQPLAAADHQSAQVLKEEAQSNYQTGQTNGTTRQSKNTPRPSSRPSRRQHSSSAMYPLLLPAWRFAGDRGRWQHSGCKGSCSTVCS